MELLINNIVWEVNGVEKEDEKLMTEDGETVMGITYFAESEIYVRVEDMSQYTVQRTIRHELTHAYLFSYGLTGDQMSEEDICNFVEALGPQICADSAKVYDQLSAEATNDPGMVPENKSVRADGVRANAYLS